MVVPPQEYYVIIFNDTLSSKTDMTQAEVIALLTAMHHGDKLLVIRKYRNSRKGVQRWEKLALPKFHKRSLITFP
jgi:hypothetical protein